MFILHIEHPIHSFEMWKLAFERDPAGRDRAGVRRYQVFRPVDDPKYVMIDLAFDDTESAEGFLAAMNKVWGSAAAPALAGTPQTRIIELVDSKGYQA